MLSFGFYDHLTQVNSDTVVVPTREDFDYQRAAVHGVISCLKVEKDSQVNYSL